MRIAEVLDAYLQNGIIKDSVTHETIGFTAEYVKRAMELAENKDVHYTRISNNFVEGDKEIKFYGWQTKKDGTKFDFTSLLGYFNHQLRFLIKIPSFAPLSPTEKV